MIRQSTASRLLWRLLILLPLTTVAHAQDTGPKPAPDPTPSPVNLTAVCAGETEIFHQYGFTAMTEERDEVIKNIGSLTGRINDITSQLRTSHTEEEIIAEKKRQALAAGTPKSAGALPADPGFDVSSPSTERLNSLLTAPTQELQIYKAKLQCLDQKIATINTPEQDFKKTMSEIFAGLIGLVIFGFFILSWRDDVIRRAIFSGQTGIQFLTLFSIVIAIILFGITGILQDKELAALLGGLSGYILGRYSSSSGAPPTPPTPPPASQGEAGAGGIAPT